MPFLPFREPVAAWTHFAGLILAIPGTWLLWKRCRGDFGLRISVLIYGFGLMLCYAGSTLFHGVDRPLDRLGPFARFDSVGIFALIAGTYTPLAWALMRGPWRIAILSTVWLTAGVSMVWLASGRKFSTAVATAVYLAMGWGVVVCYAKIARVIGHRAMFPLILGGIFYSVGAIFNLARWPTLWPGVFGTHDLFHLFVIAGSLSHYWFIWQVVLREPEDKITPGNNGK